MKIIKLKKLKDKNTNKVGESALWEDWFINKPDFILS